MAHVLLIDDDGPLREMLALTLQAQGHEVTEAETGREGLQRFRARTPDLVITDLVMPEEDGIGVLMELRKCAPGLPVVVISGGLPHSPLYRDIAEKLGAVRVLAKPFRPEDLAQTIGDVLGTAKPAP